MFSKLRNFNFKMSHHTVDKILAYPGFIGGFIGFVYGGVNGFYKTKDKDLTHNIMCIYSRGAETGFLGLLYGFAWPVTLPVLYMRYKDRKTLYPPDLFEEKNH